MRRCVNESATSGRESGKPGSWVPKGYKRWISPEWQREMPVLTDRLLRVSMASVGSEASLFDEQGGKKKKKMTL